MNSEVWKTVREMLDKFQARTGLGIDWVAEEVSKRMGKRVQSRTIYRYQERNGLKIHYETLIVLSEIIGEPAALLEFAHRMNHATIKLPEVHPSLENAVKEIIRAIKETTEGIEASAEALESGTITNHAWEKVHREIWEGIEELLVLYAVVKARWERDNHISLAA